MTARLGRRSALSIAAAIYLLSPGHPDAWLAGIPLGLWPLIALVLVVAMAFALPQGASLPQRARWAAGTLLVLAALKILFATITPPLGWEGRYFASADGRLDGAPRRSIEFPRSGATRIDRRID